MLILILACCLIVNEIGFAPSDPDAEFVELLNRGTEAIDLSRVSIRDASSGFRPVSMRPLPVEPGHYVVLVRNHTTFSTLFPGVPYLEVPSWPALNNTGDQVVVAYDGQELDAVSFAGSWGLPGHSLERIDPGGPSTHPVNWAASTGEGSPGRRNGAYREDRAGPVLLVADRLHPDTTLAIFDEPVRPMGPGAFRGPEPPLGVEWIDDTSAALMGLSGDQLDVYGAEDLFGNTSPHSTVAVAWPPDPGELLVSERLVQPRRAPQDFLPDQPWFAELWNASSRPLSLRGLAWSEPPDEKGQARLFPLPLFPRAVPPGAVVLQTSSPTELEAAFQLPELVRTDSLPAAALRIPQLLLIRGEVVIDRAYYEASWRAPGAASSGSSLYRLAGSGIGPLDWSSPPTDQEASPGTHSPTAAGPSAQPGDVVISEVLFEARNDQPEFVEILSLRDVESNGLFLRIGREPSPPDSVRMVFRPTRLGVGDRLVGLMPWSGTGVVELADRASQVFPESPDNTRWLPLSGAGSLRNTLAALTLVDGDGTVLDSVRLTPELHHPGLAATRGVSLERRNPRASGLEPTNWGSSLSPSGASPGYATLERGTQNEPPNAGDTFGLSAHPRVFDPAEGAAEFRLDGHMEEGVALEIYDLDGMLRRRVPGLAGGPMTLFWDGLDQQGRAVPPGVYIAFALTTSGRSAKLPIVVAKR